MPVSGHRVPSSTCILCQLLLFSQNPVAAKQIPPPSVHLAGKRSSHLIEIFSNLFELLLQVKT